MRIQADFKSSEGKHMSDEKIIKANSESWFKHIRIIQHLGW